MDVIVDNADVLLSAWWLTIRLLLTAAALSLVWGTVLAAMRVSPIGVLNKAGTIYINTFRNTPLLVLLLLVFATNPKLGLFLGYFWTNVFALSLYTSCFVCEAIRSGVNSVHIGQAEAARSIGMPFGLAMREVLLPQAFRAVVPPLASVLIALTKNTSLVSIFGLSDLTARMKTLLNDHPADLWWIFFTVAMGYVILVELISFVAGMLERRWRVA